MPAFPPAPRPAPAPAGRSNDPVLAITRLLPPDVAEGRTPFGSPNPPTLNSRAGCKAAGAVWLAVKMPVFTAVFVTGAGKSCFVTGAATVAITGNSVLGNSIF